MSLSKLQKLAALAGFALAVVPLAGCSLTPGYAERGVGQRVVITYPEPSSRLEQIVYQDLRVSFGDAGPGAPVATVAISRANIDLTKSTVGSPRDNIQATLTGTLTIRQEGQAAPLYTATRQTSSSYTTDGQELATTFAETDSGERAAHQLAESLRLAILGGYATRLPAQ